MSSRARRTPTSLIERIIVAGLERVDRADQVYIDMLIRAYERARASVGREIALLEAQIIQSLQGAPTPLTDAWIRRQSWYQQLDELIDREVQQLTRTTHSATASAQRAAARSSSSVVGEILTQVGIPDSGRRPLERFVTALTPGSPLQASLLRYGEHEAGVMRDAIEQGLIRGQGVGSVTNTIVEQLDETFQPYNASRIVRTEMMRAYRGVQSDQYAELDDDVIVGYRRVAALDDRCCGTCVALHNHIAPQPHDDFHVQCRCIDIPVFADDYVESPPGGYPTGEDWLRRQPEATQRRILGKSRYEAWKEGDVELTDFVTKHRDPVWGDTSVLRPVRDLPDIKRAAQRRRDTTTISSDSDDIIRTSDQLYARAAKAEPAVTRDLLAIETRIDGELNRPFKLANGQTVYPLDARLKTPGSTARKISSDANELRAANPTLSRADAIDGAAGKIKDNLRYTYTVSPGTYADDVNTVIAQLDDLGYERIVVKNMWAADDGYTSVHALYRTRDGQPFEVQFHTDRTLEVKELISHPLYEKQRLLPEGSPEWVAYQRQIDDAWRTIRDNPPKLDGLLAPKPKPIEIKPLPMTDAESAFKTQRTSAEWWANDDAMNRSLSSYQVGSEGVNGALRFGGSTSRYQTQIDHLDQMMTFEARPGTILYRGVDGDEVPELLNVTVGSRIADRGYMSTSLDADIADAFAGTPFSNNPITLRVQSDRSMRGLYMDETSAHDVAYNQKEFIFPRDTEMEVIKIERIGDMWWIDVRPVQP